MQGICLDVLAIKLKDPSKYFKLLKRCDILIKEADNNMNLGMTERRLQMAKLIHKCEVLLNDIEAEMSTTSQRPRKRKKEEELNRQD